MTDNTYDLVVWGATGVAGRLVARYLTQAYTSDSLALAVGGRDSERLDALVDRLCGEMDGWETIPTVIADATQPAQLREMTRQTAVVCTTVGPYTTYGTPLVEACVETGTDYCDLTGEVPWIRQTVDRFHDAATEADTRIVHCCGFDSVPADLGTLLVQSHADRRFDATCETVRIYLESVSGGISGGTLASLGEVFEAAATDSDARRTLGNPYSLAPPGERSGPDSGEQRLPARDPLRGGWSGPSPMAAVNERVVRRSHALLGHPWGESFRCSEVIPTGRGVRGAVTAGAIAAGLGAFTLGMSVGPVRTALQRYAFPDPGEGPTSEETAEGRFEIRVRGRGTDEAGSFTVESVIGAQLGPGYGATARMLGESGVCLLRDDTDSPVTGGVVTPAAGIGLPLADRLREAEFDVRVEGQRA